jgi:hypothetical protein
MVSIYMELNESNQVQTSEESEAEIFVKVFFLKK